ncbi:MAG TPA: hypothetical protein PKA33_09880 [Amaricoccus sp.]|uniref:hypothetical protein n=1 Tax=Amaricoccus sp. TaxID=1872485 RepID=UPI002C1B0A68|nr:hypothetical protein [Amaricoccus sp.]HMQ95370.1 hypothetical protein [Amaricoccus sp.]HMR52709.1 hypothetical protein [Amaricoccus sp.]HMR61790.1 hypothetical protein [Amaricoccus sp.]HMT99660.1 hypothetical protein [Amaricoccus sp.]
MPIFVLALALAAYAYALVTEPGFRRWGLIGGAAVGLGLAVYFWQSAPESSRAEERIAPQELTLDQVTLERTSRGATLSGRVANGSPEFRLREMTLEVRLYDCPTPATALAECPVIGEASAIARPDVPPGQLRAFTAHFVFANLPEPVGTLGWDSRVSGTRATE